MGPTGPAGETGPTGPAAVFTPAAAVADANILNFLEQFNELLASLRAAGLLES